jgi:hypothetical protein
VSNLIKIRERFVYPRVNDAHHKRNDMKRLGLAGVVLAGVVLTGCQQLPVRSAERTISGAYDVETRYDLSAFEGRFSQFAPGWQQPDRLIHQQIIGSVEANYSSTVANAFVSVYGNQLQRDITAYLNEEAPPWVMQVGPAMQDVDKQMSTVDMQTSWLVTDGDVGQMEATQIFNGVAVFEDPNCPGSGAITCDQIQLTSQELLDAEYPIEILSSKYGVQDNGQTLGLESHNLDFNYGRLGLYYLTNLILPDQPTESVGLRDVALAAINCRGLAGRLAGDSGNFGVDVGGVTVGLSLNDLVGDCEDGVFGTVNGFVDQFNAPLGMNLAGSADVLDTNRDGAVDQLTGGSVEGDMAVQLATGQSEEGPVSGLFTGFRVGDVD